MKWIFLAPAGNHKSNKTYTVLDYFATEENLIFYCKNQICFFNPDSKTLANQIEQHNIKGSSSRAKFC